MKKLFKLPRIRIPRVQIVVAPAAIRDVAGITGVALLSYGAWLHYPPLGFIVAGAILVALAVYGTIKGGN